MSDEFKFSRGAKTVKNVTVWQWQTIGHTYLSFDAAVSFIILFLAESVSIMSNVIGENKINTRGE